jgi:hypothetical protein
MDPIPDDHPFVREFLEVSTHHFGLQQANHLVTGIIALEIGRSRNVSS